MRRQRVDDGVERRCVAVRRTHRAQPPPARLVLEESELVGVAQERRRFVVDVDDVDSDGRRCRQRRQAAVRRDHNAVDALHRFVVERLRRADYARVGVDHEPLVVSGRRKAVRHRGVDAGVAVPRRHHDRLRPRAPILPQRRLVDVARERRRAVVLVGDRHDDGYDARQRRDAAVGALDLGGV